MTLFRRSRCENSVVFIKGNHLKLGGFMYLFHVKY